MPKCKGQLIFALIVTKCNDLQENTKVLEKKADIHAKGTIKKEISQWEWRHRRLAC